MPVKFTDRRHDAPEVPEDERLDAESERMRRRRDIREQAARRDIELEPAILAEQDVRASESRCDQLAEAHSLECAPWQSELAQLEKDAIRRIGRREPPDTDQDERRAELAKLISSATADLEKQISDEHELQGIARRKARTIRQGRPPADTVLSALTRPPLVNPALHAKTFILQQKSAWLQARRSTAEKKLKTCKYNRDGIASGEISGTLSDWNARVRAWEDELSAVSAEIEDAIKASDELHARKLAE